MDKAASFFGYAVLFLLSALASMPTTGSTTGASDKAVVFRLSATDATEVRYEGKWGKICAAKFEPKAAGPICKQTGYMDTGYKNDFSATPLTDIVVDSINCTRTTIDSCTFTPSNGNSKCSPLTPGGSPVALRLRCKLQTNVRLRDTGSNAHSGVIEIWKGPEKGVICYTGTSAKDTNTANVTCRQMKYRNGVKALTSTSKPDGYTAFDVACPTSSPGKGISNLNDCSVTQPTCNQVQHVECKVHSESQKTFDVRLSSSSKEATKSGIGTVEIYKYGAWGVICDTGWDSKDADVVCRELGYEMSVPTTGFPTEAFFGQGTGVVFWNNVKCAGDEPSIEKCPHDVVWGTGTCNSVDAAGVRCSSKKLPVPKNMNSFCSDDSNGPVIIPKGDSYLLSPGYPDPFTYGSNETCTCISTTDTLGEISAYVDQKMFTGNKIEYLFFTNGTDNYTLYGEDPTKGPFVSSLKDFKIKFRSNDVGAGGKGKFRIRLQASEELKCTRTGESASTPSPTAAASSKAVTNSGRSPSPESLTQNDVDTSNAGMIAGIVVAVIIVAIVATVVVVYLFKKKKIHFHRGPRRKPSIDPTPIDPKIDPSGDKLNETENGGGVVNPSFGNNDDGMKKNDIYEESPPAFTGNGNFSQNNSEYAEVVKPKNKRNLEVTEPETGEKKANGGVLRPASGSAVKVNFPNRAYNANEYELEEPVKGVEESAPNDLKPQPDGAVYAVVNKPRSLKAAKGNQGTKPEGTEPTSPNQDVQNAEKPVTDTPTPFTGGNGLYAEVGSNNPTPRLLPPISKGYTPSSAYADVDITGDKPKIDEKKEEKSPKKSPKKKTKEKKKKKDGKSGKDTPSSGRRPRQEQTSCAVPIFDDGTYAAVGDNQSGATDESYDKLNFQGRGKPAAPTGGDATYDVVQKM